MNWKIGYPVSPLRALELILFLHAPASASERELLLA